jgi:3-deoxy-D-manno-octulosonic-acid transferase
MLLLYNAFLWPLRLAAEGLAAFRSRDSASEAEWSQRRGRRLPGAPPGAIWIHGASVGEVRLVGALADRLAAVAPGRPVVVSAVTPTGRANLPAPPRVAASFFAPLDFPGPVRRVLRGLRPALLVLVETELWPNLLHLAAGEGVPVCVVNARLSPERIARYRRLRPLFGPLVARLAAIGAQDAEQADRFSSLGARASAIEITGNMKYDLPPPGEDREAVRGRLGISPARAVLVAGSTAEAEENAVLEAFVAVRRSIPDALLILAPRRTERFGRAGDAPAALGLRVARRSAGAEAGPDVDVLLVDVLGELAGLYAAGNGAFVGGSLAPVGGHNVLEPAVAGVPVAFGPHTGHVEEPASALLRAGGGSRVRDAEQLAAVWTLWARDETARNRAGRAARDLVASHRGALDRSADLILRLAASRPGVPA